MALTLNQARSVYDRIGRIQDWQAFYEDATINRLVAKAAFTGDHTIFESVAALAGWLRACWRRCLPVSTTSASISAR